MPRNARGCARLPLVPHQPSAVFRRSSSPAAKFWVRLQETEAARRMVPPSSHARLRLRIPGRGAGGQSATSSSNLGASPGALGPPSLFKSFTEPFWGGTCFSETGARGRTCGRPRPSEPRPFERFYAGPTPGHLAQHSLPVALVCVLVCVLASVHLAAGVACGWGWTGEVATLECK